MIKWNLKRRGCEKLNNENLGSIKDHEILDQLYNKDNAANICYTIPEMDKKFLFIWIYRLTCLLDKVCNSKANISGFAAFILRA
jgi:hypothetical protein